MEGRTMKKGKKSGKKGKMKEMAPKRETGLKGMAAKTAKKY